MMEIRDYQPGDETQILKLFNVAFGKPLSLEYWKWRFLDNPVKKLMIKLMWDGDKLVGHYAVSPLNLCVNGKRALTALSMTTMTHPEYTGKGIFTKLADTLYFEESNSGLIAVWGFPNTNSHGVFIDKLNWVDLEQIPVLSLEIGKINNNGDPSDILIVKSFRNEHLNAINLLTISQKVSIEKSIEYLTWRYTNNPSNDYTVFELSRGDVAYYAVTKVFRSFTERDKYEIDILELNFPVDEKSLNDLLIRIKEQYLQYDLMQINLWLSPNDPKFDLMAKNGFKKGLPLTYFGIRILDTRYEILNQIQEWYYSMGDSDIY